MKKIILLICISSFSITCVAQWIQCNGPYGGYVTSLAQNNVTQTLFAGTRSNNLFRYKKSIGYWTELTNKVPTYDQSINDLGVVDSILYVSTNAGLLKTTNDGDTWRTVWPDSANQGISNKLFCRDSILIFL